MPLSTKSFAWLFLCIIQVEIFFELWKNSLKMRKKRNICFLCLVFLLMAASPVIAEKISFKISYNTASIGKGDLNTWIESYNQQWNDWRSKWDGQLDGQFNSLKYGPKYELEIRIPIIFGLSLNLSGSHFSSSEEGTIAFEHGTLDQTETDFVRNEVKGYPIKVGFSYFHALPFLENLYISGGIGRHITFITYTFLQDYELTISSFTYTLNKDYTYNSEALGIYATLGVEYDLIEHIAIVAEAEKVWSKADGFKGSFDEELYDPFSEESKKDSGKASLYFYESKPLLLDKYYSTFTGHKIRPEDPEDYPVGIVDIRNLRQGEFDLSTFSFKIGIRFKF